MKTSRLKTKIIIRRYYGGRKQRRKWADEVKMMKQREITICR